MPTDAVAPGDLRASGWTGGSAVRDAGRAIRRAVEDALAELGLLEQEMVDA